MGVFFDLATTTLDVFKRYLVSDSLYFATKLTSALALTAALAMERWSRVTVGCPEEEEDHAQVLRSLSSNSGCR